MEGKYLQLNDMGAYKIALNLSNYVWALVVEQDYFTKDTVGKQFVKAIDSISSNIASPRQKFKKMFFYTYVLKSLKDREWYTGCADNLQKRLKEHDEGKVFATKNRRSLTLIYYEACLNKKDAYAREKYLKTGMGKRYLKNRLRKFLTG